MRAICIILALVLTGCGPDLSTVQNDLESIRKSLGRQRYASGVICGRQSTYEQCMKNYNEVVK